MKQKKAQKRPTPDRPDEVDERVWQDFLATRRAKRAALTDTALDGIRTEARKAGIPLGEALRVCCVKGWTSFNAGWNWKSESPPASTAHSGFAGKDYSKGVTADGRLA